MAAGTGGAARDVSWRAGGGAVARTLRAAFPVGKKFRSNGTPHLFFRCPQRHDRSANIAAVTSIIAHRGASAVAPENTIAAFVRAGELGADGVELDVRRTADDRLVIHHDARLADGRVIRATAASELPEHVPSFDAALDACAGMFVNVEIKNDPADPDFDPTDWVAHRVCALLARRGGGPRWLISSFRFGTVGVCRAVLPSARTAWLVASRTVTNRDPDVIERSAAAGHAALHPWDPIVDEALIRRAHAAGLAVNAWTCDDPARMRQLIGWGIDGICTNLPDVGVAARSGS
jgi:glycerophosphoryl diester phosphodiesterase